MAGTHHSKGVRLQTHPCVTAQASSCCRLWMKSASARSGVRVSVSSVAEHLLTCCLHHCSCRGPLLCPSGKMPSAR